MRLHEGGPVVAAGKPLGESPAVMIMVHGRNAGPENILDLAPVLDRPAFTYLAPAAANRTWYPYSFMADKAQNEPWLTSALAVLARLVEEVQARGVARETIMVLGFSQGACLASEFVVRNPARWGGLVAYSGGLIGPPGTTWEYPGSFHGTSALLGCSDVDAHVPKTRVEESSAVLERMGAAVDERIYPGMGHTVNDEEIQLTQRMMDAVLGEGPRA